MTGGTAWRLGGNTMQLISLCLPGDNNVSSIRGMRMPGGEDRWSVYDFINVVRNKSEQNEYGRYTFCRVIYADNEYSSEMKKNCMYLKFPGRGQRDTPTMTLWILQRLLMIIRGKVSLKNFEAVDTIFSRLKAGDTSLIKVFDTNEEFIAHAKTRAVPSPTREKTRNPKSMPAKGKRGRPLPKEPTLPNHSNGRPVIPRVSYVYATFSPAFPGLVKIGRSVNVRTRLSSGNTFSAPQPHRAIAVAPTFNAKRDERLTHDHFAQFRRNGEFFEISHEDIISFLHSNIMSRYQQDLLDFMRGESGTGLMIEWNTN